MTLTKTWFDVSNSFFEDTLLLGSHTVSEIWLKQLDSVNSYNKLEITLMRIDYDEPL